MTRDAMKKLVLPEICLDKLTANELHTVFSIPDYDRDKVDIKLHDVIQICLASGEGVLKAFGLGEVAAIKSCALIDVSPEDIKHGPEVVKTKKDLAGMLRENYPEYKADIVARTPINVTTVRRFDYDLGRLRQFVKVPK